MAKGFGQVGQLSIRVLPDTRKFKDDLRKALKRIERTVSATVQVGAELSRGSALKLKREIAALDAEMKVKATVDDADEALRELGKKADRARVQVPVTVGGVDRAWQTRLKRQVEDAAKEVDEALKGEDLDAIKAAVEKLSTESQEMGKVIYEAEANAVRDRRDVQVHALAVAGFGTLIGLFVAARELFSGPWTGLLTAAYLAEVFGPMARGTEVGLR